METQLWIWLIYKPTVGFSVGQQFYILLQLLLNCRKSWWLPTQTNCPSGRALGIYCTLPWDSAVLGEFSSFNGYFYIDTSLQGHSKCASVWTGTWGLNQWWLPWTVMAGPKMWRNLVQMILGTMLILGWSKHLNCIYCTHGDLTLDLLFLCGMTYWCKQSLFLN